MFHLQSAMNLLHIVTVTIKYGNFITRCKNYYKMVWWFRRPRRCGVVILTQLNIIYSTVFFDWKHLAGIEHNSCNWPCLQVIRYNLGQKVGDKLMKLSKIGFPMECFTADFLRFFTKKRQNLAVGWTAEYSPSNPSISGIFLKFPNFLSLKSFGNSWGNSYTYFLVIII